ncbi:MAG: peptidase M28, partial [Vicinamibacterales bacterium]
MMRARILLGSSAVLIAASLVAVSAQRGPAPTPPDPAIATMVSRLALDHFKTTLKGLTQFGDRRQGTKRNQDAVEWIAAQLKSDGYDDVERVTYTFPPATRPCGPSVPVTTPPPARAGGA